VGNKSRTTWWVGADVEKSFSLNRQLRKWILTAALGCGQKEKAG
jgi:hypothetical protein